MSGLAVPRQHHQLPWPKLNVPAAGIQRPGGVKTFVGLVGKLVAGARAQLRCVAEQIEPLAVAQHEVVDTALRMLQLVFEPRQAFLEAGQNVFP